MPRPLRLLPVLGVLLLMSPAALAWGPEGHAIVADIAQRHLTPAAAHEVQRLLALEGDTRLAQIASWPDEIRKDRPKTGPWHYVDIPLRAPRYNRRRDCPHGNCIVVKLPHFVRELADPKTSPHDRLVALKWVVHLVGDIHQPLHNEDHHDYGGNAVKLDYFGHPTNLHRMWDTGILEQATGLRMNPVNYHFNHAATRKVALRMDRHISASARARWRPAHALANIDAEAVRWSDHSHRLAQRAYRDLPPRRVGAWSKAYQRASWPVVRTQLEAAGVRLAAVLNAALH